MNIKYFATCECCNFKALSRTKWNIHLRSQKHLRNGKSKVENYVCEICGYWCMHVFNLNAHKICRHGLTEQKKHHQAHLKTLYLLKISMPQARLCR